MGSCRSLFDLSVDCEFLSGAVVLSVNRMMNWKVQVVIVLSCCIIGFDALPSSDYAQLWKPEFFPSVEQLLSRRSGRPFTISVEGNVGSGKSTVLNFFKQYPDISVYPEPVSTWTNLNGTNYLEAWLDRLNRMQQIDTGVDVIIYLRTDPSVTIKRVEKRHRHEEMDVPLKYYQGLNQLYEDWLIHGNSTGITHHPRVIVIDANKDISALQETYKYLAKAIFRSIPKQLRSNNFYNKHQQPESLH